LVETFGHLFVNVFILVGTLFKLGQEFGISSMFMVIDDEDGACVGGSGRDRVLGVRYDGGGLIIHVSVRWRRKDYSRTVYNAVVEPEKSASLHS
jgi:hypothetical protein